MPPLMCGNPLCEARNEMSERECSRFLELLQEQISFRFEARELPDGGCAIRTPFFDNLGDPVYLAYYDHGDHVRIDDAGITSGQLFTLGQHVLNTPGFRLVREVAAAHGLQLDFNRGTVGLDTPFGEAGHRTMDLIKAVLALNTAIPFMKGTPHRLKPTGPRLKTRIKQAYSKEKILDLVEDDYHLPGASGVVWPIDFHWWVEPEPDRKRDVYVVTADLNVQEPLDKAIRVTTLSLDALAGSRPESLRVVVDHTKRDEESQEAAALLLTHSQRLGYQLYDFDDAQQKQHFIEQTIDELTEQAGESWREFWLSRRTPNFSPERNGY